jgi:hypothetical protein
VFGYVVGGWRVGGLCVCVYVGVCVWVYVWVYVWLCVCVCGWVGVVDLPRLMSGVHIK